MTTEVKDEFIGIVQRAADFSGIQLVAWCIMANHFHLLVYLSEPEDIGEEETLRRYGVLKGQSRLADLMKRLAQMRQTGEDGERNAADVLVRIRSSMYDVGVFMKIVKQWLTQEYNRRYSHVGTLWEGVYKDVPVKASPNELGNRAGYIHLNPVRAAIVSGFAEYPWSSFTALCRGDESAIAGMRHIYGESATRDEIAAAHHELMSRLLEQIKFEKAEEIARRREAGFNPPVDPLTDEALIAQVAKHLERVMDEAIRDREARRKGGRPKGGNVAAEEKIKSLLSLNPNLTAAEIASETGMSRSSAYVYLKRLAARPENPCV